jgi:pilus assembly protein CpaE
MNGVASDLKSPPMRRWRGSRDVRGQAAVEVVALLPLIAAIAVAIMQALAAGRAEELAGHAAQSGAVALAEGRDGAAAARAAVPDEARGRLAVEVHGSRVQVRLTPATLIPGAAALLTATATADAGPAT